MEILLSEGAILDISKLGITKEEALDAAVLPDVIEELPDGRKEFFKHFDKKLLKMTVTVENQRKIVILSAGWVEIIQN